MKIVMQSDELQVIMGSRKDYKGDIEYVIIYGFETKTTDTFNHAMNYFSEYCEHSANQGAK